MNNQELIVALRKLATDNKTANAVFHVWALRERARSMVTLDSLAQKMKEEGFIYTREELCLVLKDLATLGVGRLKTTNGRVSALEDIRVTLQSLGIVACGTVRPDLSALEPFRHRNKFAKVVTPKKLFEERRRAMPTAPASTDDPPSAITVTYGGLSLTVGVPKDMPAEDTAKILARLLDRRQ